MHFFQLLIYRFYIPVQRVCRPDRTFRGFQGQIEAGNISVGDTVRTLPSGETASVKSIFVTDRQTETAFAGQPVTITLDREVDVSRGCVITKDDEIAVYGTLDVSLLWTDDSRLNIRNDCLVKLGTKLIPAIVTEIKYAVDVNTGEQIPVDKLSKNGIARCTIKLSEPITADKFSLHKTLGELILIDRVSNMTSACGVVENVLEKSAGNAEKASFTDGVLKVHGDIFEEFYYDVNSYNVFHADKITKTFHVGDEIPTTGKSYSYPDDFDIIVLRDRTAVKIRDKKIHGLYRFEDYQYDGTVPLVNGRGFAVRAKEDRAVKDFISEYEKSDNTTLPDLFCKWLIFDVYRKIYISGAYI